MLAITTIYGKEFTNLFVSTTLRSLAQKNNLGSKAFKLTWIIYTTENSKTKIQASKYFYKIKKNNEIVFKYINKPKEADKYKIMTAGHNLAFKLAAELKNGIIFLQPDAIYFDGIIKFIFRNRYKKAIFLSSYMVIREKFVKIFKKATDFSLDKVIKETFKNLHPYTKDHCIHSKTFRNDCPNFFWEKTHLKKIIISPPQLGLAYFLPDFSKDYKLDKNYDEYLLDEISKKLDETLFLDKIGKGIWPEMSPLKRFSKKISNEKINFIWVVSNWKNAPFLGPTEFKLKLLSMQSTLSMKESFKNEFLRLNIIRDIIKEAILLKAFKKITIFNNHKEIDLARKIINTYFIDKILNSPANDLIKNKVLFLKIVKLFSFTIIENTILLFLKIRFFFKKQ